MNALRNTKSHITLVDSRLIGERLSHCYHCDKKFVDGDRVKFMHTQCWREVPHNEQVEAQTLFLYLRTIQGGSK